LSEFEEDFDAVIENIAMDAREIERIETEKAKLDPSDPQVRALSADAEEIAERLHHRTLAERDLAETAAEG
jgi:hypothetical protein